MKINWIKGVWDKGKHNAFTDLCGFRDKLFCCFREATNHVSPDGVLRIIESDYAGQPINSTLIRHSTADLRDPKLSVSPDGKLLLIAYARHHDSDGKFLYSHPMSWFSCDGKSWSSGKQFGHKNWWLWRISWHHNKAFGFAYNRGQQSLNLYHGDPRRTFEILKTDALSKSRHGLGYPNESDLLFRNDDTAYALVRRDADTCSAQLGIARPPYTQWKWHALPAYIGGPAMHLLNDREAIVAGRQWQRAGPKTVLWHLDLQSITLTPRLQLPSSGDNSYPGMVINNERLYISYYSSHERQKSNIFLAEIAL